MSHIRGVKLERRVIVPILPPTRGAEVASIPAFAVARYQGRTVGNRHQAIAAFSTLMAVRDSARWRRDRREHATRKITCARLERGGCRRTGRSEERARNVTGDRTDLRCARMLSPSR